MDKKTVNELKEDLLFTLLVFSPILVFGYIGLIIGVSFDIEAIKAYKLVVGFSIIGGLLGISIVLTRMFGKK
jgi:hypothetical protein